jgi:hypothetical protein
MTELITVGHGSRGRWRTQAVTLPVADLFAVACPACQAPPGERCVGSLGRLAASKSHKSRATAAVAEAGAR